MLLADYFREQAAALYSLAKGAARAAERLELVLEAMEFEARAVDAERGKIAPPFVFRQPLPRPEERRQAGPDRQEDTAPDAAETKELRAQARQITDTKTRA